MALLHSLQICGIRSFNPENSETIYFNTPVTLFLGQNGCGKTTIIESIRFALTNELPTGSNNGQGFLNDPKISNKSSTKGSIKIKFFDCQGHEITVSKFMMVSAKTGGGLSFKKLSVNVRRRNKDEPNNPQDISGRCADIDNYCSTALNVSKSILNNVIFCHQENSAWPLDEPKRLKEKFDEIFDAVKYNKCVDILRKYIKEKQGIIKVLKERLLFKKSIKEDVERKRAKYNEKQEKLNEIRNKIDENETNLKPLDCRMQQILELEESFGTIQKKLTEKEAEKKGLIEQQNTVKKHISYIFDGTDEELTNRIKSFQKEQEIEENKIIDLETRNQEILVKNNEINETIQKTQIKIGQLKEEQKQYNQRICESRALIEKVATNLQISISLHSKEIVLVISDLKEALEKEDESIELFIRQKDIEENNLQNEIDTTREKYASTKQNISSKKGLIKEYQQKVKDISYKLEELDTSDSQLTIIADNIKKLQNTLLNLKNSFNETEKLGEIEGMKEIIQEKEKYLQKLEKEHRILQQNYANEQKLDREKSFIIEKQGEINRIRAKQLQNFQHLFGENIPENNYRKRLMEILNNEEEKYRTYTNSIHELQKQVTTLETNIQHQKDKLKNTHKELEDDKNKVANLCSGNLFIEVLNENYSKKEKLQRDKGQYSSAKIMYETFINKFEKDKPCCPICQTDFSNKKDLVNEIIQQLKNKIERIPLKLLQTENELKNVEDFYNNLQQLKPINDNIDFIINAKIPLMEEELFNLEEKYKNYSTQLLNEKNNLKIPEKIIEMCKSIIMDVTLLDQYLSDIQKSNNLISELESNIITVPSNRSRQESEAEIDGVKADISNLKNQQEMSKMVVDSHRERCQRVNNNLQCETQKQIDIQKLVQEKPLLETQKREYTDKLDVLNKEIEELNALSKNLNEELELNSEKRQNVVSRNRKIREEKRNSIMAIKNMINEIDKLQYHIEIYEKNNSSIKLENIIEELAELKTKEKKLENAKDTVAEAISAIRQNLAKQQTNFRALKDNEILREKEKLELKLETEINYLKKQLGDYNIKSIYNEKQKLQRKVELYQKDTSSFTGQKEEIVQQLTEIEYELAKPQNKNAYTSYKKQYYELKVQELTIKDLSNYVGVLERSVLKFHRERMVQINRTIRELWRNIYRGNDIDYIEIQTDESMTGGVNKRRTYNYKVVQVKKGVELEMRGRCSAGQKVLACLVIRMALAETFSAHCGILALDEPTTNLDRENILSLSDALSRIISTREREKHFQLLIITHDEEFLNNLSRVQSLDSYWRVKRNEDGFSTIKKCLL